MKKAFNILSIAVLLTAIVLLFIPSNEETIPLEENKVKAYVPDPCEYQLVIVDDSVVISDFGRHVATIHLSSTGKLEKVLIKDNE